MLELLIIPAILGAGLTWDFINDKIDEYTQQAKDDQDNDDNHESRGLRLNGTDASETLLGGSGDDTVFGGDGTDVVSAGPGADRVFLGDGDDVYVTATADDGEGDDFIRGGAGADLITDADGSNNIFGDLGNDTIVTLDRPAEDDSALPPTPDSAHGGYGEDTLFGDSGDLLTGGENTDHFIVAAPSDQDAAPAVVTDFDSETETLSIVFLDEEPDDLTVSFLFDEDAGVIHALVEGEEVATLSGLEAEEMPYIAAHATTLPALMASGLVPDLAV